MKTRLNPVARALVGLTLLLCPGLSIGIAGQTVSQAPPTVSGEAAELQSLLDQHRYIEFDDKLVATDPAHLTGPQTLYFSGMLAFHMGLLDAAAPRFLRAVNIDTSHSLTPAQNSEALLVLGEINFKLYSYVGAARMYGMINLGQHPGPQAQAILDNQKLSELLVKVPPQTIELTENFTLLPASTSSPMGAEYPVSIPDHAVSGTPLLTRFDTGAEISLLSATTAKAWGVTMLQGAATLIGAGGGTFEAHPGFLPTLTIGKAQLHNVAVYVVADQNLYIAPLKLQLNATLGYPVMHALGRLTFMQDGSLHVEAKSPQRDPHSTTLWLDDHALLIELGTKPVFKGTALVNVTDDRLFILDTGSGSTVLTDRYLVEHKDFFSGLALETGTLSGNDGVHAIANYQVHRLPLFVGESGVFLLDGQHVFAQPMHGPMEDYFGIIGQDILRRLPGYIIDFRTMTFSVVHDAAK